MLKPSVTHIPKHRIIEQELRAKIERGDFLIGQRIPNESAICELYGVSRITAQKAVVSLANKGYLKRTPKIGTVVTEWRKEQNKRNVGRKDITIIFVNVDVNKPFYMRFLCEASRVAESRGHHITFSSLITQEDMTMENVPLPIRSDTASGALLVGRVTALHMKYLSKFNTPYLFAGNIRETFGYPSVKFDIEDMACKVTLTLLELNRGPVWIVLEPFSLFYTLELYLGYQRAIDQTSGARFMPQVCPPDSSAQVVEQMKLSKQECFAMIVYYEHLPSLLASLKLAQIDIERVTMVVVGHRQQCPSDEVMLCDLDGAIIGEEAAKQIIESSETGSAPVGKSFQLNIEKKGNDHLPFKFSWK
jgi:DNA-binding LacI/PurR family transcriptional regulator